MTRYLTQVILFLIILSFSRVSQMEIVQKDISAFDLHSKLLLKSNHALEINGFEVESIIPKSKFILPLDPTSIIIQNNRGNSAMVSIRNGEVVQTKFLDFKVLHAFRSWLLFYDKGPLRTQGIYSVSDRKICFESEAEVGGLIMDDFILHEFQGEIAIRELLTGALIQKVGLPKGEIFQSFQLCYREKVLFTLQSGDIGIIDTQIRDCVYLKGTGVIDGLHWGEALGSAWGLFHLTFLEIDLEKRILKRKANLEDSLQKIAGGRFSKITHSRIQNDKILFITDFKMLGRFDPITERIEHLEPIPFQTRDGYIPISHSSFQVGGTYSLLLDSEGFLYKGP